MARPGITQIPHQTALADLVDLMNEILQFVGEICGVFHDWVNSFNTISYTVATEPR